MTFKGALLALATSLSLGCFKEPVDGSASCPDGDEGCACYGNGSCNADLVCSMGVCIEEGCTPGSLLCTCVDGQCLAELVCQLGACHEPPRETTGAGSDSGSTSVGTETTAGTIDPGTGGMGSVGEVGPLTTDSDPSATGIPPECTPSTSCGDCRACAVQGPCAAEYDQCQANPECAKLLACYEGMCAGAIDPVCLEMCYSQYPQGQQDYVGLDMCIRCACPVVCGPSPAC